MKAEAEIQLLQRCAHGDEAAWNRLFDEYYEEVFQFFLRQSRDFTPEDAEALCQEVFLAAIRNIASYQSRSGLGTWLLRIAMNRGRARIEKDRRTRQAQAPVSIAPPPAPRSRRHRAAPPPPLPVPTSPEEEFQLLRQALDRLGGPCRDLIELHYFGDASVATLALEFEMRIRSMRARLRKCLKRLEELVPTLTEQIARRHAETPEEEDPLAEESRKPSRHHPVLDRYLREHTEQQNARLPEAVAMPEEHRKGLLEIVRRGIPHHHRRRRRTVYEDELEEKRLRKTRVWDSEKIQVLRTVGGWVLKLMAAVAVMAALAAVVFWWLDRMSVRQAEEAGSRPRTPLTAPSSPPSSLGAFTPLQDLSASNNAAAVAPDSSVLSLPVEDIPPEEQVVRLAALAARVPPNRSGVRIEFDPPPPNAQLRKRVSASDAPEMFRRVRIVQTGKGIEVTDRWDGSFFEVVASTCAVTNINQVAQGQATELPGVKLKPDSPAVLVLTGKGTSFTLSQDIQLRLELVLQEVPPGTAVTLRENNASKAFELWLTHSRLYGEAVLEKGAKVLFEGVPVKK
jgi:RNA polymerase sigma-70 factor (ECF subfamily)